MVAHHFEKLQHCIHTHMHWHTHARTCTQSER